jgi:hypothetical protein
MDNIPDAATIHPEILENMQSCLLLVEQQPAIALDTRRLPHLRLRLRRGKESHMVRDYKVLDRDNIFVIS